jgi:biotin carboxyl carrier protein
MTGKTTYLVQIEDNKVDIRIDRDQQIFVQGKPISSLDWVEIEPNRFSIIMNGKSYVITLERSGDSSFIANINGKEYHCNVEDERARRLREYIKETTGADGPVEITAPMPGLVLEVAIREGDQISHNQPILVLEAMKMENEIRSSLQGKVDKIYVKPGQTVEKGELLVRINI